MQLNNVISRNQKALCDVRCKRKPKSSAAMLRMACQPSQIAGERLSPTIIVKAHRGADDLPARIDRKEPPARNHPVDVVFQLGRVPRIEVGQGHQLKEWCLVTRFVQANRIITRARRSWYRAPIGRPQHMELRLARIVRCHGHLTLNSAMEHRSMMKGNSDRFGSFSTGTRPAVGSAM